MGTPIDDPWPDQALVIAAWQAGGVRVSVMQGAIRGAVDRGDAAGRLFAALCDGGTTLWSDPHFAPQRGDLVHYAPRDGTDPGYRLGVVTDQARVVTVVAGRLPIRVRREQLLLNRAVTGGDGLLARDDQALTCHVRAALLGPDGTAASAPPGGIEIIDGGLAADNVRWAVDHPSAPANLWHSLGGLLVGGLGIVAGLATWALAHVASLIGTGSDLLDGVIRHLGWVSALSPPLLITAAVLHLSVGILAVLTTSFDGSGLHRVLTGVVVGALTFVLLPLLTPLLLASTLGRLTGWWSPAGLLSGAAALIWNTAGFAVTTLTGIDDGQTRVLEVVLAVVADATLIGRPMLFVHAASAVAERLAGPAASDLLRERLLGLLGGRGWSRTVTAGRRGVDAGQKGASLLSDWLTGRPAAVVDAHARAAEVMLDGRVVAASARGEAAGVAAAAAPLTAVSSLRVGAGGVVDVVSWLTYRPASVISDLVSECGRFSFFLTRGLGSVDGDSHLLVRAADQLLAHLTPEQRETVLHVALPAIKVPGDLSTRHTGAQLLGNLAAGVQPRPAFAPLLPQPLSAPPAVPPAAPPLQPA